MISRPESSEYNNFYSSYVNEVVNEDMHAFLIEQRRSVKGFFKNLPSHKIDYNYQDGKWTIRQVLRHMIDAERIFANRILRIARGEQIDLPGFEQEDYVETSDDSKIPWSSLIEELDSLRAANVIMVSNLPLRSHTQIGKASGFPISTRALIFIMAGHVQHHMNVLHSKYMR